MPTLVQYIETPEAFSLDTVMAENPEYLNKFIEFLTTPMDPILNNERQCYLYPSKVADLLSTGMAYRLLIQKDTKKPDQQGYPYLELLFTRIKNGDCEPTLLGYCSKVLISLVKKTPEIYEFINYNQQLFIDIVENDDRLEALRQFLALLLIESTMQLYVFLKSMLIRNIIFKMVADQHTGITVYRCISYFYEQLLKALEEAPEDEKNEVIQVCKSFEEESFVTLLIFKLDTQFPIRNYCIANFLEKCCTRKREAAELVVLHIDTILDYLEEYEQSSIFMETIQTQHISMLKLLVELVHQSILPNEIISQLVKRLLVYSNIHANNSFIHNLLCKAVAYCRQQGKVELLNELNIVPFFLKSQTPQRYGFMSLRLRIFKFWIDHKMDEGFSEEEKTSIRQVFSKRNEKLNDSKYYVEFKVGGSGEDLGSTKIPADLSSLSTGSSTNSSE